MELYKEQYALQAAGQAINPTDWLNVTVGENIDRKIKSLQEQIDMLKSSKESLRPLLSMKIGDIQQAMNY